MTKPWEEDYEGVDDPSPPWEDDYKEKEEWYEDFAEGLGVSGLKLAYGLKDLIPGLEMTEENRATIQDWEQDARESGWGYGGEVVGEIAQMLVPATKAKYLAKLNKWAKGHEYTSDAVKAASLAGIRAPDEGESRLENMGKEAALSYIGGGVGRVLSKPFRGANMTDEAESFIKDGGYLTPAQATKGGFSNPLENLMAFFPGTARGTQALRDKAVDSYSDVAIRNLAPNPSAITKSGEEAVEQFYGQIKHGYDQAWGSNILGESGAYRLMAIADDIATRGINPAQKSQLKRLTNKIVDLAENGDPKALNKIDIELGNMSRANKKDVYMSEYIKELREELLNNLDDAGRAKLKEMDELWPEYLGVLRASKSAHTNAGKFNPKQHSQASSSVGGRDAGRGVRPGIEESQRGLATLGHELESPPFSRIQRLSKAFPSPTGVLEGAGNVWLGQTSTQKLINSLLQSSAARPVNPGVVAPSLPTLFEE